MKVKGKLVSVSILVILLPFFALAEGCGNRTTVPDGSTITISPDSVALTNIPGDTPANFKIIVRYSDGTPIPNAVIHITGAFAVPADGATYQFFYYPDGTQRVGGNAERNNGFNAQTDDYGVYNFSVEVFGPGVTFDDTINVTSGTAVGSATLALTVS